MAQLNTSIAPRSAGLAIPAGEASLTSRTKKAKLGSPRTQSNSTGPKWKPQNTNGSDTGPRRIKDPENLALRLSPQFALKCKLGSELKSLVLEAGFDSINQYKRALVEYRADLQLYSSFSIDTTLIEKLRAFEGATKDWISFRDSFRAQKDARTIPSDFYESLLENRMSRDE